MWVDVVINVAGSSMCPPKNYKKTGETSLYIFTDFASPLSPGLVNKRLLLSSSFHLSEHNGVAEINFAGRYFDLHAVVENMH